MYGDCLNYLGHGTWGGGFMMFLGLLAVILIIYFLFKKQNINSNVTPTDLLNTKYINGEITKEEYEEKLNVLKKNK